MAVVHHVLRCEMSAAACAAATAVAELAHAGDADGLSKRGEQLYREAASFRSVLAAFELSDPEHVEPWLAPETVHPALVTLLAWVPGLVLLGADAARALAAVHRCGGSPVGRLAPAGAVFLPLPRALAALFDASPFTRRPSAGQLGAWAHAQRLASRLRRQGDFAAAGQAAAAAGSRPQRTWLVTTTVW